MKKRVRSFSLGVALALSIFQMISITTASAADSLTASGTETGSEQTTYEVNLYEGIDVADLLPDQWQQYDICHMLSEGYVVGGFQLGSDFIAPMSEDDSIVYLNQQFQIVWT